MWIVDICSPMAPQILACIDPIQKTPAIGETCTDIKGKRLLLTLDPVNPESDKLSTRSSRIGKRCVSCCADFAPNGRLAAKV